MQQEEFQLDELKKEDVADGGQNMDLVQREANEPNQNQENQSPNLAPKEMIEEDADIEKEANDSNRWP